MKAAFIRLMLSAPEYSRCRALRFHVDIHVDGAIRIQRLPRRADALDVLDDHFTAGAVLELDAELADGV